MSKHFDKANRELIKKENRKLQIEQERLEEKKRLAELQQKTIIFWNGIVGFAQKYLLMLYRVFKPKELNQ